MASVPNLAPRIAYLNDTTKNQQLITTCRYAENVICTSKYTIISFIPKTIFEFFRVVANIYFLFISLIQLATPWSPTNQFTTAGPLVFVLVVTMLKQGSEDYKRHQADNHQNNRTCHVVNEQGHIQAIPWKSLTVGQLLLIRTNEELPADIVILSTSEEEGRCFIETSNLDGETNLKRRVVVKAAAQSIGYRELNQPHIEESVICTRSIQVKGSVEYELPNNQLYNFTGRLLLENTSLPCALGPENIMLRGCSLRSCAFVLGIVIFTGAETKLLQNSRAAPSKQSKLYKTANRCMLLIFFTMFLLCIISAIVAAIWNHQNANQLWYLPFSTSNPVATFIVNFFTFLILYNNLVPISLYVSLDIIKVLQARSITMDPQMFSKEGIAAISRTSDLNEELGQIEYIFSDKTGTLTCNVMEFRKCSIGGVRYGFGTTEIGRAVSALQATDVESEASSEVNLILSSEQKAQVFPDPSIHFDDPRLLQDLAANTEQSNRINEFLTLLSICHTVIPERDGKTGTVHYRASSPDEEALVKAAKCLGYNFIEPAPCTKIEISTISKPTTPKLKSFMILNVNEFNSTRKRMSIVCLNEENQYVLYCKGADNMMLSRSDSDAFTEAVQADLRTFAREGLRTLVLGRRVLSEEEYRVYNEQYLEASTALKDRERLLDAAAESIEHDMTILGVTAIEDKLQDHVPQTIYDLAQAGIKIWVLTGDREETAINIGHACKLLNESMKLVYINQEHIDALEQQIETLCTAPSIQSLLEKKQVASELGMICDGKALIHLFPTKEECSKQSPEMLLRRQALATKLLKIASCCRALIACRVSPSQKAEMVNLVRKGGGGARVRGTMPPITLAIGDGANDVSMIQTAHVGVGICGKEGVQAVNASDYAIAQFSFLKQLILIHGRYNYKRIAKVILYSFYKNIAMVMSLFLFNFFNGQSGSPLYESFVMAGWNFFLATPIIVIGVYDQDVPEEVALHCPKLYQSGPQDQDLNLITFAKTIFNAMLHAWIGFWICYLSTNKVHGLFTLGTVFYSALLTTMKLKVILLTQSWTKYHILFLLFSIWLFYFFLIIYPQMTFLSYDMYGVPKLMFQEPLYWHLFLMTPITACLMDFTWKMIQQQWFPCVEDILREKQGPFADIIPEKEYPTRPSWGQRAMVVPQRTEFDLPEESIDAYNNLGFAFNGPSREGATQSERDLQELVTMRVTSYNELRNARRSIASTIVHPPPIKEEE